MSNTTNIKTWDDARFVEDINNNDDISMVKFAERRQHTKEKKAVEE